MKAGPIVLRRSDIAREAAPVDAYAHELAMAQAEAMAVVLERVARALDRIGMCLADLEAAPSPAVAVAPGQLRLVVGGP